LQLVFRPDGRRLALSFNQAGKVQVYEVETGRQTDEFVHPAAVGCMAWRNDGRLLVVGCEDQQAYVWDSRTQEPQAVLEGHENGWLVPRTCQERDFVLTSDRGGAAYLWDPIQGRQHLKMDGTLAGVRQDGRALALVREDRLRLFEVAGGGECRTLHHGQVGNRSGRPAHWGPIHVDFFSDGRLLASASADGVRLWNVDAGDPDVAHFPIGHSAIAQFNPRTGALATDSEGGLILWPMSRGVGAEAASTRFGPPRVLKPFQSTGHAFPYWSRDGRELLVADPTEHKLALLDPEHPDRRALLNAAGHLERPILSSDAQWAACVANGVGAEVWRTSTRERVWQCAGPWGEAAFSPDGRWLVTSLHDKALRFWHIGDWTPGPVVSHTGSGMAPLAFSPDGNLLADASAEGVRLVKSPDGDEVATLTPPRDRISTWFSFSPDSSRLAVATQNHTIHLWDLRCLRHDLAELELDWDLPAFAAPAPALKEEPMRVQIIPGAYQSNVFVSLGVIEAETLPIVAYAGCDPGVQDMRPWPRYQWSSRRQLVCVPSSKGAYIELLVEVPAAAKYTLDVYPTKASDYATVGVSIDGKQVGEPVDCYHREVMPAGKKRLGIVDLNHGAHRLRFTAIDKNQQSSGYVIGIDCLELTPVK
jgi:WD40 repeat protein